MLVQSCQISVVDAVNAVAYTIRHHAPPDPLKREIPR
jgi:hypothetical protein